MKDTQSKGSFTNNINSQSQSIISGAKNVYPSQRQVVSNRYDTVADESSQLNEKESMRSVAASDSHQALSVQSFTAVDQMEDTLDNENFSQRLDQLILNFRTETM